MRQANRGVSCVGLSAQAVARPLVDFCPYLGVAQSSQSYSCGVMPLLGDVYLSIACVQCAWGIYSHTTRVVFFDSRDGQSTKSPYRSSVMQI